MSSSATIQVSHSNDGSLRIDLTIHSTGGQSHMLTMQQGGAVRQQYQIQQPQPLQQQMHRHQYQLQPPRYQQQPQQQRQPQQGPISAASQIESLSRSMRNLIVDEDIRSPTSISSKSSRLLQSLESPPPKLNYANRQRKLRAAQASASISKPQVIGIPDVPEYPDDDATFSQILSEAQPVNRAEGGAVGESSSSNRRNSGQQLLAKAPQKALMTGSGSEKLARSGIDGEDDADDILREMEDAGFDRRRKRQPSSTTTNASAGSPYQSNASNSPMAFSDHTGVPTPLGADDCQQLFEQLIKPPPITFRLDNDDYQHHQPSEIPHAAAAATAASAAAAVAVGVEKRKRGRPKKEDSQTPVRQSSPEISEPGLKLLLPVQHKNQNQKQQQQQQQKSKLQLKRQEARAVKFNVAEISGYLCDSTSPIDFIPSEELQDASKIISKLDDGDLTTPDEFGDLLCHKLARERNWAKVVALNLRLLSGCSFGDIFAGINTANGLGRTVLLEAINQQNDRAVAYCCLFTSTSDYLLLRGLAEAALLPVNDVCDEIFAKILDTICHDVDINGNAAQRANNNRLLNSPIDKWSFSNPLLADYVGLNVLQILVLQPPMWHGRLTKLVENGANTRCPIGPSADSQYRPYSEACYLAAKFSTDPLRCLEILGMSGMEISPNQGWRMTFDWDCNCEASDSCAKILQSRQDLSSQQLADISNLVSRLPVLKAEEIEPLAPGGQISDLSWVFDLKEFTQ